MIGERRGPPDEWPGAGRRGGPPQRRLLVLWCLALLGGAGLIVRVVGLQVDPSEQLLDEGERQRHRTIPLHASRGSIIDRNGADLAISVPQKTIAADARAVADPLGAARRMAPILGWDPDELANVLASDRAFVYLARQVNEATAEAVLAEGFDFVWAYTEPKRVLPGGEDLGRSVIGRTDIDLNGVSGIERAFDDLLAGQDGELVVEQGIGGRTIPGGERQLRPATPGTSLVLAMDRGLQFEAEKLLAEAVDRFDAAGGTVLVSHVATGEMLVDANVARRDDGSIRTTSENRALTWTFEPGSVNKIVTLAGVIEDGAAESHTTRHIPVALERHGRVWRDDRRSEAAEMSLTEILAVSSNVGTMTWALDLGPQRFEHWLRAFGLGRVTGADFPGESPGLLGPSEQWSGTSLPTIAIGQGIAVTPMQMLGVYNTIANGGRHVSPQLVLGAVDADGTFSPMPASRDVQVVSEPTAAQLTTMLEAVVAEGTGQRAQVEGFRVAGKTGTAWKVLPSGGYGEPGNRKLVTTFVGFLPAEAPELSILVVLDEPAVPLAAGGSTAAPLFAELAAYAVRHMRIPPTSPPADSAAGHRVRSVATSVAGEG